MKNKTSRRTVLQGMMASTFVLGFDVANSSWVTEASAASRFESLPLQTTLNFPLVAL